MVIEVEKLVFRMNETYVIRNLSKEVTIATRTDIDRLCNWHRGIALGIVTKLHECTKGLSLITFPITLDK